MRDLDTASPNLCGLKQPSNPMGKQELEDNSSFAFILRTQETQQEQISELVYKLTELLDVIAGADDSPKTRNDLRTEALNDGHYPVTKALNNLNNKRQESIYKLDGQISRLQRTLG